jgi:hypothetical protein
VTLEVMGEGWSMGPLNEAMEAELLDLIEAKGLEVAEALATLGRTGAK